MSNYEKIVVEFKEDNSGKYTGLVDYSANIDIETPSPTELSKKFEIDVNVLKAILNSKTFHDDVFERFKNYYALMEMKSINKKLIEKAKSGNLKCMEIYYNLIGKSKDLTIPQDTTLLAVIAARIKTLPDPDAHPIQEIEIEQE